jgi:hypothetical protein
VVPLVLYYGENSELMKDHRAALQSLQTVKEVKAIG